MKKIEAIIREEKLSEVKEGLEAIEMFGMTVCDVKGRGKQKGIALQWRAGEYRIEFLPKKLIIMVVNDDDYQKTVDTICEICGTGNAGDGKLFVTHIDEAITIRTRESGEKTL
jgi:nitrogen regulatory protein P-II 1